MVIHKPAEGLFCCAALLMSLTFPPSTALEPMLDVLATLLNLLFSKVQGIILGTVTPLTPSCWHHQHRVNISKQAQAAEGLKKGKQTMILSFLAQNQYKSITVSYLTLFRHHTDCFPVRLASFLFSTDIGLSHVTMLACHMWQWLHVTCDNAGMSHVRMLASHMWPCLLLTCDSACLSHVTMLVSQVWQC